MAMLILIIILWRGLTSNGILAYHAFTHYTRIVERESYHQVRDTDSFITWLEETSNELIFQGNNYF